MFELCQPFTATHIAKPLKPTLKPKLGKECVCPTRKKENQIKTSPSLDWKKGEISLRKCREMGATVANRVDGSASVN
jgi:hypothetical protein